MLPICILSQVMCVSSNLCVFNRKQCVCSSDDIFVFFLYLCFLHCTAVMCVCQARCLSRGVCFTLSSKKLCFILSVYYQYIFFFFYLCFLPSSDVCLPRCLSSEVCFITSNVSQIIFLNLFVFSPQQ